jgi:hypothetical protein
VTGDKVIPGIAGRTDPYPGQTYVSVPDGTAAYWEDWARYVSGDGPGRTLIATVRRDDDGRADAEYIVDRLASGLYAAHIVEIGRARQSDIADWAERHRAPRC